LDPSTREKIDLLTINIAKVNSTVEKVRDDVAESSCDPAIIANFNLLCTAIELLSNNQSSITTLISEKQHSNWSPMVNSYANAAATAATTASVEAPFITHKKPRTDQTKHISNSQPNYVTLPGRLVSRPPRSGSVSRPPPPPAQQEDPDLSKFKDAVKDAEKSILLLNLNMGKVPLLNTETISKRATLALTSLAANVEKPGSTIPSHDVVSTIDDILSVSKGMSFYGTATKTYRNPKDLASGSYCTIPVRYDFKDRETRIQAESILRTTCKINCVTPYHPMLRECIKQTGERFREKTGDDFVRVNVDIGKMVFKIYHKKDKKSAWQLCDEVVRIPREAYNIAARKAPLGFRMRFDSLSNMEIESETAAVGATATAAGATAGAAALAVADNATTGKNRVSRKDSSESISSL
jgi:major membrane immunogen (membrane-anchored lipoprotein)